MVEKFITKLIKREKIIQHKAKKTKQLLIKHFKPITFIDLKYICLWFSFKKPFNYLRNQNILSFDYYMKNS